MRGRVFDERAHGWKKARDDGCSKGIRVIISGRGVHSLNDSANSRVKSLAVSLSGGGHRATLFVLGALMYLADAKGNAHVTSIASVSGRSLTNGFVDQTLNFRETDGSEFRERVAIPLATQIAKSGTLFAPLFTKVYLVFRRKELGSSGDRHPHNCQTRH